MLAAELAAICPQLTRWLVLVDTYGLWLDEVGMPDPFVLNEKQLGAIKWADLIHAAAEPSIFLPDAANPNLAVLERTKNLATATKFMWPIPDRGLHSRLTLIGAYTDCARSAGWAGAVRPHARVRPPNSGCARLHD
jgi:hypothetical protein